MKRFAVCALILGMALLPVGVEAQQVRVVTDVRAELLMEQSAGAGVMIELKDGSRVTGVVNRFDKRGFEVDGRPIAYSSVAAFLDPVTGKPIALVRQTSPTNQFRPRQYSTKTVVIVAVAVTVFLIWVRLSVPHT